MLVAELIIFAVDASSFQVEKSAIEKAHANIVIITINVPKIIFL